MRIFTSPISVGEDRRPELRENLQRTRDLIDEWEGEVKRDLELCERHLATARINDQRGGVALKVAGAGLGMVVVGGLFGLVAGAPLAMFPGLGVFTAAILVTQVCTGRRDHANLERQMLYRPALHKAELLKSQLHPRLERQQAELGAEEERVAGAQVRQLAEGLGQPGQIGQRQGALVIGGTVVRPNQAQKTSTSPRPGPL